MFLVFLFSIIFLPFTKCCSFFNLFSYDYLETMKDFEYPYWNLPSVKPGEAIDEAIMLIGGKKSNFHKNETLIKFLKNHVFKLYFKYIIIYNSRFIFKITNTSSFLKVS